MPIFSEMGCNTFYRYKSDSKHQNAPLNNVPYNSLYEGLVSQTTAHGLPHVYNAQGETFTHKAYIYATLRYMAAGVLYEYCPQNINQDINSAPMSQYFTYNIMYYFCIIYFQTTRFYNYLKLIIQ